MSQERKSNLKKTWMPTASKQTLRQRAAVLRTIREFFYARNVLEVDTPVLGARTVTDPFIESLQCNVSGLNYYLQTSPEYFMKRLLAADSGSIYQIGKVFRADEQGRLHNPEFTMLEWYRVGFDCHQLMAEMDGLIQAVLGRSCADKICYQDVFLGYLNIDPLVIELNELKQFATDRQLADAGYSDDKDDWLMLLFSQIIEPKLQHPTFVYDFPASQSALAKISQKDDRVAERFELYIDGVELANGFHELSDPIEQRRRFQDNLRKRQQLDLPLPEIDEDFLSALEHGLPDCSGVALGLERLIMLACSKLSIAEVQGF